VVPLLPWLVGVPALAVTLALTVVALVVGGMAGGWLTGRPVFRPGLRQLVPGGLAITVTYLVGHMIGAHGA
jgi:vacuolar iron transporter family protein